MSRDVTQLAREHESAGQTILVAMRTGRYPEHMRRVIAVLLGLAVMGAGIRLLVSQSARNAACNASTTRGGMQPICQHIVFSYLGSFAIIGAGFLMFLFGLMVMKKKNMRSRRRRLSQISKDPNAASHRAELSMHSKPAD